MRSFKVGCFALILVCIFSGPAFARSAPDSFADLVENLTPSVVNISTSQVLDYEDNPFSFFFHDMPGEQPFGELPELFERFYGDRGGNGRNNGGTRRKASSLGSGFIISSEGYIVTNYHVIEQADEITVVFSDENKTDATIIGKDKKTDIALLKVNVDEKLPAVRWGNSDKTRVGDWVIAIGNPFGLGGSVSAGIISARARDINAGPFDDFLQTDAAINRGNSGGPLFNINGEVIGVNSAIFSPSGGNIGIGFAVPSAMAKPVINQLQKYGRTHRGWLGVKIQTVTNEIAESLGLKEASGALVLEVTPDSPAGKAGVVPGDVILRFDDKDIPTMRRLPRVVADTKVGKKVPVLVWRKGKKKMLAVEVAELDEEGTEDEKSLLSSGEKADDLTVGAKELLGMKVSIITKAHRKRYRIKKGVDGIVVVKIDADSNAMDRGLRVGDVIEAINQEPIFSPKEAADIVKNAVDAGRKSVLLLVDRDGESHFVALSIE